MSEYSLKWKPHQKIKKKNNKIKIHWNDDFPYWIWAHENSCGAAWFWQSEGILPSPCSLFKLLHAPALGFLAGFLSSLTLSQLSHCPSLPFQAQGHFSQKKPHCLQANQVSELLLDATSSWTQNCTSSNTSLPLYRLVCKEFSEVSILVRARPDLQLLPSLLWGKCTAGCGGF